MAIIKKVVEANSSCMAHLSRVARISGAWLGVARQYEGTISEGLPKIGKWLRRSSQVCRGPLNVKHLHKIEIAARDGHLVAGRCNE
jgi:hypothetical protein